MELVSKQGNRLTHMRQMEWIGSELETSDLVAEAKMLQMDLGQGKNGAGNPATPAAYFTKRLAR